MPSRRLRAGPPLGGVIVHPERPGRLSGGERRHPRRRWFNLDAPRTSSPDPRSVSHEPGVSCLDAPRPSDGAGSATRSLCKVGEKKQHCSDRPRSDSRGERRRPVGETEREFPKAKLFRRAIKPHSPTLNPEKLYGTNEPSFWSSVVLPYPAAERCAFYSSAPPPRVILCSRATLGRYLKQNGYLHDEC